MKRTEIIMGMPITIEIVDSKATGELIARVFDYFSLIDNRFSTYKDDSEVTRINKGLHTPQNYSQLMRAIIALCEQTKKETGGYFNAYHNGYFDPSGVVKGWAIREAAKILKQNSMKDFYIDAGGDIQVSGKNATGKSWVVGIRNPFNRFENVKILQIKTEGVATSGTYIRGNHIYNPKMEFTNSGFVRNVKKTNEIVSLTVIGSDVFDADRFATGAFAMGAKGIKFIESLSGYEGYMIDQHGIATMTSGMGKYVL